MADHDADKSQEATPHRREKAREKGHLARSHDLASAVILVAGVAALMWLGSGLIESLGAYTARQLGGDAWLTTDTATLSSEAFFLGGELATTLLPILGLLLGVAITANLLQTGPLFLTDKLLPDWSHVNPLRGLERLFSLASAVRLGFGLIKISLIAAIAAYGLWQKREEVLGLVALEVGEIAHYMVNTALWLTLQIAVALLLLAILDYGFQRWKYERDLRMTPQEVREELKDLQGDPHVIARRRQVQRQLAMSRVKSAIPTADVVVTNPTE
ncbi:MAG: EscU/YscU/HrcU family type III secretion system export apparatus switch protein, partial [Pirellulales bacterium]